MEVGIVLPSRGVSLRPAVTVSLLVALAATARAQEPAQPVLEPPQILEASEPVYPPEAATAGKTARVKLELVILPDGTTGEVKVLTPAGDGFDEAAVAAIKLYKWVPGKADGQPVAARIQYDVVFELKAPEPPPDLPAAGTAKLSGLVRQRGSRKPLAGAELAAVKGSDARSATTGEDGRFVFDGLPAGKWKVTVLAADHRRRDFDEELRDGDRVEVKYLLTPEGLEEGRTVATGERPREELERRTVTAEQAQRIPGTRGDALRVVENLPGVARPPFGAGALIVRGAAPEDTAQYIDGHFVPLIYHFGGITSIVQSDLLSKIDFLPGNFSARYGRATGGIVEADFREPRKDRLGGHVDISLLDAGFLLEGPVGKGSFAVAGRRSWVDAVLSVAIPDDAEFGFTTAPRYWDYQALFFHPLGGGDLRITAFGSSDKLALVLEDPSEVDPAIRGSISSATYVQRLQATWRRRLGDQTDFSASFSQGYTGLSANFGETLFFELSAWFNSYRVELEHRPFERLKLVFGAEGQFYPYHVTVEAPRLPDEGDIPTPISAQEKLRQDRDGFDWRAGFYSEAQISLPHGITITPGTRAEYVTSLEKWTVDPRLALRWTDGTNTVRAGIGRYSQQPLEFQTDSVFGNPDLRSEHAIHYGLGYDRELTSTFKVESTFFYKTLRDLATLDDALVRRDGELVPIGYSNQGTGRIYGAELLARWQGRGPLFGWLSYTVSRSERRDAPTEETRLFSFDQTHILTAVGSIELPWGIIGGLRFRLVSGNPDTPIIGSLYDADADVYLPIPGEPSSVRLPMFHQLDLRLEKKFRFDSWMLTAYLDIQNVYNRGNPEAFTYSYDYRERVVIKGLPFFPAFGIKGEL
jgi:TonB family protein